MRCCIGDGGWPSAVALQGEAANHRKVRRSRAGRAERCGKGAPGARQVRAEKANASKPLMTCRNAIDDIETGTGLPSRDQPGGCLLTGQAVSGMEVARARLRLRCGTWEPVAPMERPASGAVLARGWSPKRGPQAADTARGRVAMRGTGADRLVVAMKPGNAGGATGAGRPGSLAGQPSLGGRSR
jgi:hypothetical protein